MTGPKYDFTLQVVPGPATIQSFRTNDVLFSTALAVCKQQQRAEIVYVQALNF